MKKKHKVQLIKSEKNVASTKGQQTENTVQIATNVSSTPVNVKFPKNLILWIKAHITSTIIYSIIGTLVAVWGILESKAADKKNEQMIQSIIQKVDVLAFSPMDKYIVDDSVVKYTEAEKWDLVFEECELALEELRIFENRLSSYNANDLIILPNQYKKFINTFDSCWKDYLMLSIPENVTNKIKLTQEASLMAEMAVLQKERNEALDIWVSTTEKISNKKLMTKKCKIRNILKCTLDFFNTKAVVKDIEFKNGELKRMKQACNQHFEYYEKNYKSTR